MQSEIFKVLNRGIKFDRRKHGAEMDFFRTAVDTGTATALKNSVAKKPLINLDFFGFDSAEREAPRKRKLSEASDTVPRWAGGRESEPMEHKHKEGSKERRKRRLSEDVASEAEAEREKLQAAKNLMTPKNGGQTASKKKTRKARKAAKLEEQSAAFSDEDEGVADEHDEDDGERNDQQGLSLFHGSKIVKDEKKKPKKTVKEQLQIHQEEISHFRRKMNIAVSGTSPPDPITQFEDMPFQKEDFHIKTVLLKNIEKSAYKEPTPIQMESIPSILSGRDVLGIAPTGSGKTAAFAIPILGRLKSPQKGHIRAVLLAPTRELAKQLQTELERLCTGKKFRINLHTKATASTMAHSSKNSVPACDILVSTPLRLVHSIQNDAIDLSRAEILCLDEADKLFEMGFIEQVDEILNACGSAVPKIQRCMFSATMLQGVEELANTVLRDPVRISIGIKNAGASTVNQRLVFCGREEGKLIAIRQLVQEGLKPPVLIFLQSKERAKELYTELIYDGLNIDVIHAERTQEQRDSIIRDFRAGKIWVLICTDLMARGIDFKGVQMVINYDLPQSVVSYIHRIGRTGRAGRTGEAVTMYTESDMQYLRSIANVMKLSGSDIPEWMLTLKKPSHKKKKRLERGAPERKKISTVSTYDLKKTQKKRDIVDASKRRKQIQADDDRTEAKYVDVPKEVANSADGKSDSQQIATAAPRIPKDATKSSKLASRKNRKKSHL